MEYDFVIYRSTWEEEANAPWRCESNKDGMVYTNCRTYAEAAAWCDRNGYSHN